MPPTEDAALSRSVGMLDRPGQATQAAMMGDLPSAWRSMFQPEDLTPDERDQFLKKLGLDKKPYDAVFRSLTNPLLILSLAFSHKFPIPAAGNLFKLSERVGSLTSRFPILGRLTSMQALFRGTHVPDTLGGIIFDVNDFRSRYGTKWGMVIKQFEQSTGRLPTKREQIMASSWLDGLHKPMRGWAGKNGRVRVGSGETTKVLEGVNVLMPDLERKMGAPLLRMVRGMRGTLDDMWKEAFGSVEKRKRILQAIARQRRGGFTDEMSDAMEAFIKNPNKIPDYFPRRVLQTEEDFRRMVAVLTDSSSSRRYAKSAVRKTTAWATPETYKRQHISLPAADDLDTVKDLVDPTQRANLDAIVKAKLLHKARVEGVSLGAVRRMETLPLAKILEDYPKALQPEEARRFAGVVAEHHPRSYSLKLMPVLSSYTHTLAGTYGWTIKGGGDKMMGVLDELKSAAKLGSPQAKARAQMLEETYIPIAMGRGTFRQALRAQSWEHGLLQMSAYLETPGIRKVLGPGLADMVKDGMRSSRGGFSFLNLQRKAAGWFYLSTLGLNPGSALKNLLQLVLTTGPTIGYRTTAMGLERGFRRSHKYFAMRLGPRKMSHEAALREAYPDFAKAGLVAAPITEEVVQNSLRNAYDLAALPAGVTKVSDKIQRAMMSMFTASETTVRIGTFEAGLIHAARGGMKGDDAIHFARKLVEQTQFLTGPQNTPHFLLDKGPLFRQLMQFPFRMLEFATSTAWTLGGAEKAGVLGLNPGTMARMVAGSVLALELGDVMGINAGDALLGGALPTFTPLGKVGAPLPVIPPAFQILGAGAAGLATGDFTELVRSSPLLVPGGVQAAKMSGLLPPNIPGSAMGQRAARLLERNYADYEQPAPDGRIAVYTGKGTLKGFYTPWELTRYALGVKGGDMQKEQSLMRTLVKQREPLRAARVEFLHARMQNNAVKANTIATQFKQRFGFDLPVSEKDVEAMQLRRSVSRLEQMVRTLPPGEARDRMVQVIAATLGQRGQSLLGIDPELLGEPANVRQAGRQPSPQPSGVGKSGASFSARSDLGPTDTINTSRIGRTPGANQAQPPF